MAKYDISIQKTLKSKIDQLDFDNIPFGKAISDHMFVADFDGEQWTDLRIVPFGDFSLSPANLALHYGQSIFEGMKATKVNGAPYLFRPMMHAKRLNKSAARMSMPQLPEDLFLQSLRSLIAMDQDWIPEQDDHALYIRPFMFATDALFGVQASKTYRFVIFTGPVGPYYPKPVKLWVEEVYTRAALGGAGEAKCAGNYGAALLPTYNAKAMGYDQVMWMDAKDKKYVQEVGTMNLFFVIDGRVVTPTTTGTILRGITRDSFLTILRDQGYDVEDRLVSINELYDASLSGKLTECFGAGTAAVVSHVAEITWRNHKIELPPVDAEHRPVGTFIKSYLNKLRTGKVQDPYGWMEAVPSLEGHSTPVELDEELVVITKN